jgi:hypothetical protein
MLNYICKLRAALVILPGVLKRHVPANTLPIFKLIHTTDVPDVWTENFPAAQAVFSEDAPSSPTGNIPNLLGIPLPTRNNIRKLHLEVKDAWKADARLLQGLDLALTADLPL